SVGKIAVGEGGVEKEIVVDGMVHSVTVFSAESEINGGHAQMVEERSVVGPGAKRPDTQVSAISGISTIASSRIGEAIGLQALPHGDLRFRILNIARHAVDEALESVRSLDVEEAAHVGVGIDICHALSAKLISMGFHPLRRPEQARLLAVPKAINDR